MSRLYFHRSSRKGLLPSPLQLPAFLSLELCNCMLPSHGSCVCFSNSPLKIQYDLLPRSLSSFTFKDQISKKRSHLGVPDGCSSRHTPDLTTEVSWPKATSCQHLHPVRTRGDKFAQNQPTLGRWVEQGKKGACGLLPLRLWALSATTVEKYHGQTSCRPRCSWQCFVCLQTSAQRPF